MDWLWVLCEHEHKGTSGFWKISNLAILGMNICGMFVRSRIIWPFHSWDTWIRVNCRRFFVSFSSYGNVGLVRQSLWKCDRQFFLCFLSFPGCVILAKHCGNSDSFYRFLIVINHFVRIGYKFLLLTFIDCRTEQTQIVGKLRNYIDLRILQVV